IGADHDNLVHMKRCADRLFGSDYHWSILAAGRHQMSFVTMGAIMGGHDDARGDSPLLINETPQASDLTESAGV
ncbi:MAG TPA: 3-keto-5-aminohexanoate cleavage protein, partial [Candidatus Limnocylindria bacterium]